MNLLRWISKPQKEEGYPGPREKIDLWVTSAMALKLKPSSEVWGLSRNLTAHGMSQVLRKLHKSCCRMSCFNILDHTIHKFPCGKAVFALDSWEQVPHFSWEQNLSAKNYMSQVPLQQLYCKVYVLIILQQIGMFYLLLIFFCLFLQLENRHI